MNSFTQFGFGSNPYANLLSPEQKKQRLEALKKQAKESFFKEGGGILRLAVRAGKLGKSKPHNRRNSERSEYTFWGDYVSQERVREKSGKYLDNLTGVDDDSPDKLTIEKAFVAPLKKLGSWLEVKVSIEAELFADLRERAASAQTSWVEVELGVKSLQIDPNSPVVFKWEHDVVAERGKRIYLRDPSEPLSDRDNWTAEETGYPLERIIGRAACVKVFDVTPADDPRSMAPDIDYSSFSTTFADQIKLTARLQRKS